MLNILNTIAINNTYNTVPTGNYTKKEYTAEGLNTGRCTTSGQL